MGLQGDGTQLASYLGSGTTLTTDPGTLEGERRLKIMVADDEAVVRTVLKSMLTRLGYDVVLADNAAEAINVYESHHGDIDLVFFDLFLPDMTGDLLYAHLRTINPATRAVLVTGNCESELIPEMVAAGVDGILGKPFDVAELKDRITKALAA